MTYSEKLKDPRWQKKRLEIIGLDGSVCRECFESEPPFHVHHIYYEKGCEPWEYPDDALITFCPGCHEIEHDRQKNLKGMEITIELQKMGLRAKHFEWIVYMIPFYGLKFAIKNTHSRVIELNNHARPR